MPVTEIIIFDASDRFRKEPEGLFPVFDIALNADGVLGPSYYGAQIEDGSTGYLLLNWESFEAHQALIDGPQYATLGGLLKPFLQADGHSDMYHVEFSGPTVALDAPVTEVFVLTLKAPGNRADVVDILSKISETSKGMFVFGKTREDENKYIVVCGWPTVETHWEVVAKPESAAVVEKLLSLANKEHLSHTKLSAYHGA